MVTDTDFRLLHEKLDRFEQKLKELETDVKVLKAYVDTQLQNKYQPRGSDQPPADLTKVKTFQQGAVLEIKCFFDNLSPEDRMKPMSVSCPCPKCSPYSMGGSLQSTSAGVWMNPRTTIDAVGSDSCKITKERKDE